MLYSIYSNCAAITQAVEQLFALCCCYPSSTITFTTVTQLLKRPAIIKQAKINPNKTEIIQTVTKLLENFAMTQTEQDYLSCFVIFCTDCNAFFKNFNKNSKKVLSKVAKFLNVSDSGSSITSKNLKIYSNRINPIQIQIVL